MPRLSSFKLKVVTGDQELSEPLRCKFNGHVFELDNAEGGTKAGETFAGSFAPQSFVHGFTLMGPEKNSWSIDRIDVSYDTDDGEWAVAMGPIVLDETNELNLWREKTLEAFDV